MKEKVIKILAAHDAIRGPKDNDLHPSHPDFKVGRDSFVAYLTEVFTQAESVPALVARIEKLETAAAQK